MHVFVVGDTLNIPLLSLPQPYPRVVKYVWTFESYLSMYLTILYFLQLPFNSGVSIFIMINLRIN